jgi:hypothetical protein
MFELLIACGALLVGFAVAWFLGGKTRVALAEAATRLALAEQRIHETQIHLTAARADLAEANAALQAQSSMRAAAEALRGRNGGHARSL